MGLGWGKRGGGWDNQHFLFLNFLPSTVKERAVGVCFGGCGGAHGRNTKREGGGGVADRVTTDRRLSPVVLKVSHKVGRAYNSRREGKANGHHHKQTTTATSFLSPSGQTF
ncbi:unnamed protein product [Boreogadus saida]